MQALATHVAMGFGVALTPVNLLYCLIGVFAGTFVGVLPGFGPTTALALLLPLTFKLQAIPSFVMLAGIYYGAHHSGKTTAIMLNMPGEPSSVVICLDGYPLARKGRTGPALCIAAISAFSAGCISIVIIAAFAPVLASAALSIQAPGYCAVVLLALVTTSALSHGSFPKTMAMAALGMLLATVGTDVISGARRFTFGLDELADGIDLVPLAIGFFAFAEIISRARQDEVPQPVGGIRGLIPAATELAAAWKPILRGTGVGAALGMLPGTGPLISSFAEYSIERRLAADPSRFGKGAIEGIAGPEAADNAAALTHFVPMLTLGIPAGAPMALMLGALMIQGITPGPLVMVQHPDLFWGSIASMWIGNAVLLILNLPLVGIWVRFLSIPYRILYPGIVVICCIGAYSVRNSIFDVEAAAVFGISGYLLYLLECPPAPLLLGFILGPIFEDNLRRALLISRGNLSVFVTRPVSAVVLGMVALVVLGHVYVAIRGYHRSFSPADPGADRLSGSQSGPGHKKAFYEGKSRAD
ncbi:MAG: tripartite tricarboxylate transporter permease [Bradyrhizobium sp.]